MLVAIFLFLFNGVMPMWVRDHLGPEACCFSLICSVCLSFVILALVNEKLNEFCERKDDEIISARSRSSSYTNNQGNEMQRRINRVNEMKPPQAVQSIKNSGKDIEFLLYFHIFVGTVAAIIFGVAVTDGSLTIAEFAGYLAIPTVIFDLIYFGVSMNGHHNILLGLTGAIQLAIWGWGLSLFSIAIMTVCYTMLFPLMFITIFPVIIICAIIIWLFK